MSMNAFPEFPTCGFCADKGITFDEFNGYRFCTCKAGLGLLILEPNAVFEANEARRKLGLIGVAR